MRGHTLVWYDAMPSWTEEIRGAAEAERELVTHIERVVSHYRGRIKTWHVVNEPIDDVKWGAVPGLRPNVWLTNLGENYIDLAFRTAHRVDPAAELLINEHGIEGIDPVSPKRRQAYLTLIRSLLDRGVPIHGVGLQGHILGKYLIDRDGMYNFVSEIRSLGLSVHVTELDVIDHDLPAAIAVRDTIVAGRTYDFLEAIFAAKPPVRRCDMGHYRPLHLDIRKLQAQGWLTQPSSAVRQILSAKADVGRDRAFLPARGVENDAARTGCPPTYAVSILDRSCNYHGLEEPKNRAGRQTNEPQRRTQGRGRAR